MSLKECQDACLKRKLCFGIEFWPKYRRPTHGNCMICPTNPSKTNTISVVSNPIKIRSKSNPGWKTLWSNGEKTGAQKIIKDRQIIDTSRLNVDVETVPLKWATVYGKNNGPVIRPGFTNGHGN